MHLSSRVGPELSEVLDKLPLVLQMSQKRFEKHKRSKKKQVKAQVNVKKILLADKQENLSK